MRVGILPFGSGDSSVIFEHDLKSALVDSDVTAYWSSLLVGSAALGWDAPGDATHLPTHDPELGLKQVSSSDGSTEVGYRFNNGGSDATLIDLSNSGCMMFEIEAAAIDEYSATYNDTVFSQASTVEPISGHNGSTQMRLLRRQTNGTNIFYPWCKRVTASQMDRDFGGWNLAVASVNDPMIYANMKGRGRFVRIIVAWNGAMGYLAVEDPGVDGPIIISWSQRDSVIGTNAFQNLYLAGFTGVAGTFLSRYYMRNLTISNKFPVFALSKKYPKVLGASDSMIDYYAVTSERAGGVNTSQFGIQRAFHARGLRTECEFSEQGGQELDEAIVYTPTSITSSGTTAIIEMSEDPGWETGHRVSVAGADQPQYNGDFDVTKNDATHYEYTMASAASASPATGTLIVGRSVQVSVYNILDAHPDARGIVVHALTNDLNSAQTAANSLVDYKSLIDKIFGYDNMDFVICVIPPARMDGTDLDLQEEYNSVVFPGVKSYVESTYPSKIVEFADVWTSTGGRTQPANTLDSSNVHYAPYGASCLHWELYQAMLRVLARG